MTSAWDVLVVGAGPAGATAAALLARQGHEVLVLEKERFPRFRIGESLLPASLPVLARLEIDPDEHAFVYKRGAAFVCEKTGRIQRFAFDDALDGSPRHAWHVDRARFDALLAARAAAWGAVVRHGETVLDAGADEHGAWVRTEHGRERARFLIDASGQARLTARRKQSVEPIHRYGSAAVFTHFEGIGADALAELGPGFDILIVLRDEGWGWVIPLPDARLSVGLVARRNVNAEMLERELLAGKLLRRLTHGARRLETRLASNFSYTNSAPHGPRHAAVGDAACFLDPVFSSGVTLALRGAAGVVDALSPALASGSEAASDLLATHALGMERAYRTFGALIDRFYNTRFARHVFLGEPLGVSMRRGVLSVLGGDVWRADNPFQDLLLRSRRGRSMSLAE